MHGMYAGKERRNRMVALVLALVLVAGMVLALVATVVQAGAARAATTPIAAGALPAVLPAHPTLLSVVPADGAELATGPTQVQLTFSEPIPPGFTQLRLLRDGTPVETGEPQVDGRVVTAAVTGERGPGAYRFVWQVTGSDGHRLSGESSFTVTAGAAGSTPRVTPTYKTPQTQPTTFGHPDHLPGLIVAGILLLAGVALLLYEHRRRAQSKDPGEGHQPDTQDRQRIS
jgi:methionine-rich copper-binding protein CopC